MMYTGNNPVTSLNCYGSVTVGAFHIFDVTDFVLIISALYTDLVTTRCLLTTHKRLTAFKLQVYFVMLYVRNYSNCVLSSEPKHR